MEDVPEQRTLKTPQHEQVCSVVLAEQRCTLLSCEEPMTDEAPATIRWLSVVDNPRSASGRQGSQQGGRGDRAYRKWTGLLHGGLWNAGAVA